MGTATVPPLVAVTLAIVTLGEEIGSDKSIGAGGIERSFAGGGTDKSIGGGGTERSFCGGGTERSDIIGMSTTEGSQSTEQLLFLRSRLLHTPSPHTER